MNEKPRLCLLALIGLPAVGKSTLCQQLIRLPNLPFNVIHLCYDDFYNVHEFNYKQQREKIYKIIVNLVQHLLHNENINTEFHQLLNYKQQCNFLQTSKDFIILCDDNNYYSSMRHKIYQTAQAYSLSYAQIYFELDTKIALIRNSSRAADKQVPSQIIQQMALKMEKPATAELCYTLFHNALNEMDLNMLTDFLLKSFNNIIEKPVQANSSEEEKTSNIHHLDLQLRQRIKHLVSVTKENKQQLAQALNQQRQYILQDFREMSVKEEIEVKDLQMFVEMLK